MLIGWRRGAMAAWFLEYDILPEVQRPAKAGFSCLFYGTPEGVP